MTLKEVIKHKNANGDPYLCDISRWFDIDVGDKRVDEIQVVLKELQEEGGRFGLVS